MIIDKLELQHHDRFWCDDCRADRTGPVVVVEYAGGKFDGNLCLPCAKALRNALMVAIDRAERKEP